MNGSLGSVHVCMSHSLFLEQITHVHQLETKNFNLEKKLDEIVELLKKPRPSSPLHIENGTLKVRDHHGVSRGRGLDLVSSDNLGSRCISLLRLKNWRRV